MGDHRLRGLIWWRKWTKREWAVAAAGFAIFIIAFSLTSDSRTKSSIADQPFDSSTIDWVPLTLLRDTKIKGAFCLDGSAPGYHLQRGFGSGADSWVLHIEGGGWCNTIGIMFFP
ncbi:hypothetical protein F0562_016326 [Nyssa sinensis]|uniref:Pectin acetylesterase n=1 Tax=Nyssa sinensis TaxID=561372 RepID=A0A5J4ZJP5_9ASTE|nr:hypothetical protein F0562_016326 [Nyssa sinensis]